MVNQQVIPPTPFFRSLDKRSGLKEEVLSPILKFNQDKHTYKFGQNNQIKHNTTK